MNPKALVRAATSTIALIGLFTPWSEVSGAVKGFFALVGNHWVGKSIFSLVAFGVVYVLFARYDDELSLRDTWWLIGVTVVSGLAIVGFFVGEFFG